MFGPISRDAIENVRFFEQLCRSDPQFSFRYEAKQFLAKCLDECEQGLGWIRYHLFLLLIQRGELDEALSLKDALVIDTDLSESVNRYVQIVSALALADLGRSNDALKVLLKVQCKYRDMETYAEMLRIINRAENISTEIKQMISTLPSRSLFPDVMKKMLGVGDEGKEGPNLVSEDWMKLHKIGCLVSTEREFQAIEILNQPSNSSQKKQKSYYPEVNIYRVPNASISYAYKSIGVFDQDGNFFEEVSSGIGLGAVAQGQGIKLSGNTALLSDWFVTSNYCHWLYDTLTRINYIRSVFSEEIDHWIVPSTLGIFVSPSVQAFGIDPASLISLETNSEISVESLIVTSSSATSLHPARNGWLENIDFLQSHLLSLAGGKYRHNESGKRILVSRADVVVRNLIGETELFDLLRDTFGFERISPGTLPFDEQIALFSQAEIVIGLHGAGLANIVFCKRGTLIIEISSREYGTGSYSTMARSQELEYALIYGADPEYDYSDTDYQEVECKRVRRMTSIHKNVVIGVDEQALIVDRINKYLAHTPTLQWRLVLDTAVKSGNHPFNGASMPQSLKSRPKLWLNRGFPYKMNDMYRMAEIHGVRGYLTMGDVPFLFNMARAVPPGGTILEIGSFLGLSAIIFTNGLLSKGNYSARVICVDTWLGSIEHQDIDCIKQGITYDLFLENISQADVRHNIFPLKGPSLRIATLFGPETLDAIFIDGDHSYEGCMADLEAWWPKCKKDGFFFGHDAGLDFGVEKAVRDFADRYDLHMEIHAGPLHYMWAITRARPS
jgi:predicted O-methyltransferase YrrM